MPSINPVYLTITIVKITNRDDFGTGFFYNFMGETYLITNKHVLDPPDGENAEEISYFIRGFNNIGDISWIRKSVSAGTGKDWYQLRGINKCDSKPNYDPDIAVMPINQRLSDFDELINNPNPSVDTGSLAFTPNQIMRSDEIVSGGDIVLVIGYPDGLLDSNNYFPLIRDARISTPFGVNFQEERKFITDALMYPGMSGSPIVAGPRTLKNPATGGTSH